MNDAELLKYSEQQRLTATKLLSESGLLHTLMKFGDCSTMGGYKYDLMYGPDIDIVVRSEDPREASVRAIKELIDARQFQKYQYGDFEKFSRKGRPTAFIIVIISEIEGVRWETEIWFQKQFTQDQIDTENLLTAKLTSNSRLAILKLKNQRDIDVGKRKISSPEIYRAVLVDGVTDYSEILTRINK